MTATDSTNDIRNYLDGLLLEEEVRAKLLSAIDDWLNGRAGMSETKRMLARFEKAGLLESVHGARVVAMMESQVSDDSKTIPGTTRESDDHTDPFGVTTVLQTDVAPEVSAADERLQIGTVLRDRFLLQERVAGGSMGTVYKAMDRRLAEVEGVEPWVAIKVLSPQMSNDVHALRALKQEAAKGRCLTHPNIVRFVDLDREDDVYFIVMEWIDGQSLASLLDAGERQLSLAESLDIVRQAGEALDYAHRCGVVHADVKPGNIMVLPSGAVKLIDFGIAHVRQHQAGNDHYGENLMRAATPAYSSMQVLTGEDPVPADDVFSLACLAYRLIAGHRVFGPRNAAEAAQTGLEPQRPASLSNSRWKALRKALSHSRVARYATPMAFVQDLARPPDDNDFDEPVPIRAESKVEHRVTSRRPRWPYALLPLLAIAAALVMLRPAWIADSASVVEEWLTARKPGPRTDVARMDDTGTVATTSPDAQRTGAGSRAATSPARNSAGTLPQTGGPAVGDEDVPGDNAADAAAPVDTAMPANDPALADRADSVPPAGSASGAAAPVTDGDPPGAGLPPAAGANDGSPVPTASTASAQESPVAGDPSSIVLAAPGEERVELDVSMTEGDEPRVINVFRWFGLGEPLTVRVDEIGYSGNQSPRESGQYRLSGDGIVSFDAGQRQATLSITMANDTEREPDRQVSLRLRDYYNASSELGLLNLSLVDDDQRAYESDHAVNTVTFAATRMVVRERDPAVSIDVLRLNPDQNTLNVPFFVETVTATDGEDFFAPGRQMLQFGPGQRTARLLIPLVQDTKAEGDESFFIELQIATGDADTFPRIEVMIRDDDTFN